MTPAERNAVLEEAAQRIEGFLASLLIEEPFLSEEARRAFNFSAAAIRALKEQEPTT